MKSILITIVVLFASVTSYALNWEERNEDGQDFLLCSHQEWSQQDASNCFNEIFFKRHTLSYYGATMFASSENEVKLKVLSQLAEEMVNIPKFGRHPEIIELIKNADWLALAVVEEDMKVYHLYTINNNVLSRVLYIPQDWFANPYPFWGFPDSSKTQEYEY